MPRPKGLPKTGGRKKGSLPGYGVRKQHQKQEYVKATVDRVLAEYSHIAFLDIGEAFAADGSLLPIHEMPESVRRAMAGIEVASLNIDNDGKGEVGKLHKIKLLDKGKALQDLAKHLGMFVEQVHNTVTVISSRETLARELDERRKKRASAKQTE